MRKFVGVWIGFAMAVGFASAAQAEPGWSPVIIATGEYRQQIQSTPIELRPYRPLHFYGNSVRRSHYRGTALPVPREAGVVWRGQPSFRLGR